MCGVGGVCVCVCVCVCVWCGGGVGDFVVWDVRKYRVSCRCVCVCVCVQSMKAGWGLGMRLTVLECC